MEIVTSLEIKLLAPPPLTIKLLLCSTNLILSFFHNLAFAFSFNLETLQIKQKLDHRTPVFPRPAAVLRLTCFFMMTSTMIFRWYKSFSLTLKSPQMISEFN